MRFPKISSRLFLPIIMFVGVLAVGVRLDDAWNSISTGAIFDPIQTAQAENTGTQETKHATPEDTHTTKSDAPAAPPQEPDTPESKLYKQLAGRRDKLEALEKELDARETIISVAEKRIDQKMNEMRILQKQLKTLLGQASSEQAAQIANLVKIYETMKPQEAARIFEKLEMDVLLNVVQRM